MSKKLLEILGLEPSDELTVADLEAAHLANPVYSKAYLDVKLSEIAAANKAKAKAEADLAALQATHEAYVDANTEPAVDPRILELEQGFTRLTQEKLQLQAKAEMLGKGVDANIVDVMLANIKLTEETQEDVIGALTDAILGRETALQQEFVKKGASVEAPAGGQGGPTKTAKEIYDNLDFKDYDKVAEFIKTYPKEYEKFSKER